MPDAFDAEWDSFDDEWEAAAVPTSQARVPRDPRWLERSQRKQDLAREGVAAEVEAEGPTDNESRASRAMGIAEGLQTGLAPFGTDREGLKRTAMFLPSQLPVAGAMHAIKALAGVERSVFAGDDDDGPRASNEDARAQAPEAFGEGELGGALVSTATGIPSAARGIASLPGVLEDAVAAQGAASRIGAYGRAGAKPAPTSGGSGGALSRIKAAIDEQGGLRGVFGRKAVGKVLDDDVANAAFPKGTPAPQPEPAPWGRAEWTPPTGSSSATAPAVNVPRPSPSSALLKFSKPIDDVANVAHPDAAKAALPDVVAAKDIRAEAVAKMSADDVATEARLANLPSVASSKGPALPKPPKGVTVATGPAGAMRVPVDPHAMPGDKNYGVTMTIDEIAELQAAGKMRTTAPPSASLEEQARAMPLATPAPRPLPVSDKTLKAAVEQGVRDGVPMSTLARKLSKQFGVKILQEDIGAMFKGAQNSMAIGPQGYR